ncbi:MAG TPA: universal stress protein [Planctomycetota bacterium]|jgi:nucleotide-binding universal stress UspA family protein|nr:universal stress protein [Planctomycetota bacterium]
MQKIVVGYDGSEHADRALDRAVAIAGSGASLVVVSAAHLAPLTHDPALGTSAVDPIEAEWARTNLDKARARLEGTGVDVRTVEGHGDPADALVRQAETERADLIVVGTRGLNAAQRALMGSVSTKVVHHAHCDVLVVR